MIRAMDRFAERHPKTAFLIAFIAALLVAYIAQDWDHAEDTAIRVRMFAPRSA